jgi:hypothetical protein
MAQEKKDECRGICLEQTGEDGTEYTESTCKPPCKPVPCPRCKKPMPQWVLDCNGGKCMNCAMIGKWKGEGYCMYCRSDRKMPNIGTSRQNGAGHDDWDSRKYHKKCWKAMKENDNGFELEELREFYECELNESEENAV